TAAVVDVVAAPLDDKEDGAVEMAVLLSGGAGALGLDMPLGGLPAGGRARCDAGLAIMLRTALPGLVAKRQHARLIEQVLGELAIGAFERAHEGAVFLP